MSGSQYDQTGFCIQRGSTKARKDAAFAIPGKPVPVLKEACRIMSSGGIMSSVLGILLLVVSASGQGKPIGDSLLRSIVGGRKLCLESFRLWRRSFTAVAEWVVQVLLSRPTKFSQRAIASAGTTVCLWGSGTPAHQGHAIKSPT